MQGVGHVGYHLCKELHEQGAKISVADVDPLKAERATREFGANVVPLEKIFDIECDVIAPCAPRLRAQRHDHPAPQGEDRRRRREQPARPAPAHGDDLFARGILYAPDYAINAGGLVNVAQEVLGYDAKKSREKTMEIYNTIYEIADRSSKTNAPTYRIADMLVEEKLALHSKSQVKAAFRSTP